MTHIHGLKSQKIVYHLKQRKAICPKLSHLKFLSPKGKQFYLSLSFILPSFNPFTLTPGLFLEHAKPTLITQTSFYLKCSHQEFIEPTLLIISLSAQNSPSQKGPLLTLKLKMQPSHSVFYPIPFATFSIIVIII